MAFGFRVLNCRWLDVSHLRKCPALPFGEVVEPAKQVEPLYKSRFRLPHHGGMHTTRHRDSLCDETSAQTTLRNHHAQSRKDIVAEGGDGDKVQVEVRSERPEVRSGRHARYVASARARIPLGCVTSNFWLPNSNLSVSPISGSRRRCCLLRARHPAGARSRRRADAWSGRRPASRSGRDTTRR